MVDLLGRERTTPIAGRLWARVQHMPIHTRPGRLGKSAGFFNGTVIRFPGPHVQPLIQQNFSSPVGTNRIRMIGLATFRRNMTTSGGRRDPRKQKIAPAEAGGKW